jgi:hypothetical protein
LYEGLSEEELEAIPIPKKAKKTMPRLTAITKLRRTSVKRSTTDLDSWRACESS